MASDGQCAGGSPPSLPPRKSTKTGRTKQDIDPESDDGEVDPTTQADASSFPPGQGLPEFVPLGTVGVASQAQGNAKGISSALKGRIIVAERDASAKMMTFTQIHQKYPAWNIGDSRVRGLDREARTTKEERRRVVKWTLLAVSRLHHFEAAHCNYSQCFNTDFVQISALTTAVPNRTRRNGTVGWKMVKADVYAAVGKRYGELQLQAKWGHIQQLPSRTSMAILDPVQPIKLLRQRRALEAAEANGAKEASEAEDSKEADGKML